ncbi:MAG: hypothetical protein ACD_12C00326G0002 [uncultured bacterium]|nr:MAG: hypothetical protein ACD_12C00326G0002 [uncultured bacterium]
MNRNFLNNLLIEKNQKINIQFFRYLLVGGIATLVDLGSLFVLTDLLGIYYLISGAIAFILGLLINYLLARFWVFRSRYSVIKEFMIFSFIGLIGLGLNELLLYILVAIFYWWYLAAKIVSIFLVLVWNFLARRKYAFKY